MNAAVVLAWLPPPEISRVSSSSIARTCRLSHVRYGRHCCSASVRSSPVVGGSSSP